MMTLLSGLLLVANSFISVCYFVCVSLIVSDIQREEQEPYPLVVVLLAILFTCAIAHANHALAILLGESHSSISWMVIQAGFDAISMLPALLLLALRRYHSFLSQGPILLAMTQEQLQAANRAIERINTNLESAIEARTADLWQTNKRLMRELGEYRREESDIKNHNQELEQQLNEFNTLLTATNQNLINEANQRQQLEAALQQLEIQQHQQAQALEEALQQLQLTRIQLAQAQNLAADRDSLED
jgi:hypothetical protein